MSSSSTEGAVERALRRRMTLLATEFRRRNPLPEPPSAAGSFPIAANVNGRPAIKTLAWYPSLGCWWSRSGGCTFCNFGSFSDPGDPEQVVERFRAHLQELDQGLQHLHIAPGGSFFSDRELDAESRRALVGTASMFPFLRTLGVETRPNELTLEKLIDVVEATPATVRELYLGFGLESRSDMVRNVALNKGYRVEDVLRAREAVEEANRLQARVRVMFETYVMVKPLFLSEGEAIDEAVRTVEWSYANGAETAVLFLNTVKTATLQELIAGREDLPWPIPFQTPYYRTGVEILRRLPDEERVRTALLGIQSGMLADGMPRGCALCAPMFLGALMAHNFTRDAAVLAQAATAHCPCREAWLGEVERSPELSLAARIELTLDTLEPELGLAGGAEGTRPVATVGGDGRETRG